MWISWQQHVVCMVHKYSCMMITTWLMSVFQSYEDMAKVQDPDSERCIIFKKDTKKTLTCIGGLWANGFTYVNGTTATLKDPTGSECVEYAMDETNGLWTCETCQTSDISLLETCCDKALSFDQVKSVIENEEEQMKF